MNFRTTSILIVLLAAVGLMLFFARDRKTESVETAANSTDAQTAVESTRYLDVAEPTVNRIAINRGGEKPIVIQRDGVQWKITEPISAPADAGIVTQFVDQLANLHARGRLSSEQTKSAGTG